MPFDGKTYDAERDKDRLKTQLFNVWRLMKDSRWRTLEQISVKVGCPEASVSARLRDFRKRKFGSHTVERQYVRQGLFKYRLIPNEEH
jgi:hypothetical protein